MAEQEDREKRVREIRRRLVQIKVQMDRLRQTAFLNPRVTGQDRYQIQHAKKDLDRLTEENNALRKEFEELTGESAQKDSEDSSTEEKSEG
jgi:hypothetical protein